MSDPPKRLDSSLEMTAVRPRPPLSDIPGPTIEMLDEIERLSAAQRAIRDAAQDRETQMECPWCRVGLVSPKQRDEWLDKYPELTPPPPSQPEEPPPSRPEAA